MPVSTSTISGLLKEIYDDRTMEDLQNKETATWKMIGKSPKSPDGQGWHCAVNVQGNQAGQRAINELEALPTPANQVPLQWVITPKIPITHVVQVSGLSMEIAEGGEESFTDNLTFQMDRGLEDAGKELNAQLFRDGSGVVALANGAQAPGATVIPVDTGVLTHFREGEVIDFVFGGVPEEVNATINSIDINASTITLSAPTTIAITDNAEIYRTQVWNNAPAGGKELTGLPLVVDDGTLNPIYQQVDRTVYAKTQGISFDAGGANLSNDLLQRSVSRVKTLSNGKNPSKIVSNTQQFRKYLDVVTPLKRFEVDTKMDSGHTEVPVWNGKEWIEDTDCNFDRVYMLSPEFFEKFETLGLTFDSRFGGDILKWQPGFDSGVAYAKYYGNVGSRVPNSHVAITNLNVPQF